MATAFAGPVVPDVYLIETGSAGSEAYGSSGCSLRRVENGTSRGRVWRFRACPTTTTTSRSGSSCAISRTDSRVSSSHIATFTEAMRSWCARSAPCKPPLIDASTDPMIIDANQVRRYSAEFGRMMAHLSPGPSPRLRKPDAKRVADSHKLPNVQVSLSCGRTINVSSACPAARRASKSVTRRSASGGSTGITLVLELMFITRRDVQMWLYENARMPLSAYKRGGMWGMQIWPRWKQVVEDDSFLMCPLDSPDSFRVMVGGGTGRNSCVIPGDGLT